MAKEKKCECKEGAPMWMVTYGDLMSLLLTFFVLLLSFATMEEPKKYEETMLAIRGAFGVLPQELTTVRINPLPAPMKRPSKAEEDLARRIRRRLQVIHKEDDVKIEFDEAGGLKINLPSQILYDVGQVELKPEAYPVLTDLSALLSGLPNALLEVRGHTDDVGIAGGTVFRDNHDISYGRADAVARHLNQAGDLPLDRFEIVGCGSGQPIAPNTTTEGRMANRRVEIFVRGILSKEKAEELKTNARQITNPFSGDGAGTR